MTDTHQQKTSMYETPTFTQRKWGPPSVGLRRLRGVAGQVALGILLAGASSAQIVTVGPNGDYAFINEALHSANWGQDADEIRIAAGTYEYDFLHAFRVLGGLVISGGWDENFESQAGPDATVIDGEASSHFSAPMWVGCEGSRPASIKVSNLTLTRGSRPHGGGGAAIAGSSCSIELVDLVVLENKAIGPDTATGAGLFLRATDDGSIRLDGSEVRDNVASAQNSDDAVAGGVFALAEGSSTITVSDSDLVDNRSDTESGKAYAAGLYAAVGDLGTVVLDNLRVTGNRSSGPTGAVASNEWNLGGIRGQGSVVLASYEITPDSAAGSITASRLFIADNPGIKDPQLRIDVLGDTQVRFSDSLTAGGPVGLEVAAETESDVVLNNLTVADNDIGAEIDVRAGSSVRLSNSILARNDQNFVDVGGGLVELDSNWIGPDPGFGNVSLRNFRPVSSAPTVDAGNNDPVGGLNSTDLGGGTRLFGLTVDMGAFEYRPSSSCSFEAAGFGGPVIQGPCLCFRDPILWQMTMCSLELPGIDLAFRFPWPQFGVKTPLDLLITPEKTTAWTSHHWLNLGGKDVFQGTVEGFVAGGKTDEAELLLGAAGKAKSTLFRSDFEFVIEGSKGRATAAVEIDLDAAVAESNR